MFNALKKFFAAKEEVVESVDPADIDKWFSGKFKDAETKSMEAYKSFCGRTEDVLKRLEEALDILALAELRNKKITTREIQFMEGNRNSYIQKTKQFAGELKTDLDSGLTFFLDNYGRRIAHFTQSTSRPYTILQEFLSSEARNAALLVKEVDKEVQRIQMDTSTVLHNKLKRVEKEINSLVHQKVKKKEIKEEIKRIEKELKVAKEKYAQTENKEKEILGSKDHSEYLAKNKELETVLADIKKLKDTVYHVFSPLERPLRKYERMAYSDPKLVTHYYTDPAGALIKDTRLAIKNILTNVEKNTAKLGLKDKKLDKTLKAINDVKNGSLDLFHEEYEKLKEIKDKVKAAIEENLTKKELLHVKNEADLLTDISERLNKDLNRLKNELSSIKIKEKLEQIRTDLESAIGIKLNYQKH